MNNAIRAALVGALATVAGAAFAQQQDFSKVEIKVTKVSGSVYMLEGAGGNIAASVGDDGIVIVDDQFAPLADKIRAALKGITDKPLRFIINTHYHFDHTGGNLPLHDATIIAHDNVRKRLAPEQRARQRRLDEDGAAREPAGSAAGDHVPARRDAARERRRHPRAACAERSHRRRQHRVLPEVERPAHRATTSCAMAFRSSTSAAAAAARA